jgi:hypothetical protein
MEGFANTNGAIVWERSIGHSLAPCLTPLSIPATPTELIGVVVNSLRKENYELLETIVWW